MELPYGLSHGCPPAGEAGRGRGGGWKNLLLSDLYIQSAVIKTLAYAAVFNYPLTSDEIYKYILSQDKENCYSDTYHCSITNHSIKEILYELLLSGRVGKKEGYYFLKGMESSVVQRKERSEISLKKLARAENFKKWARFIPTIKLIGISGALAMNNAHEEDDIDLFIVAQSGTVWITRFLTVLLAEILGVRRRPESHLKAEPLRFFSRLSLLPRDEQHIKDKICLNMFVDDKHMSIPTNERDLFSAHEVVQMRPIYDKDDTYSLFIKKNEWAKGYMPNAIDTGFKNQESRIKNLRVTCYVLRVTAFIEQLVKRIQLNYMQSKRTNEVIKDGYLRFHPVDSRRIILRRYSQIVERCTKLHL